MFATTVFFTSRNRERRSFEELQNAPVRRFLREELLRLASTLLPEGPWNGRRRGWIDWVAERFDYRVAKTLDHRITHMYGYEDCCAASFSRAKELNLKCIYDLPTAFHSEARNIFELEAKRDPTLKPFLEVLTETPSKIQRKRTELHLADLIIVASEFTRKSVLRHHPTLLEKVKVVPYGITTANPPATKKRRTGPLRILFAGVLGPRKGLHHLIEALQPIPKSDFKLSLAGSWVPGFEQWIRERFAKSVRFECQGRLLKKDLWRLYSESDVLVFPSLCDGFGMVILEAMSNGTPVLASERTAGPDLFSNRSGGMLFNSGNISQLTNSVQRLIDDPTLAAELGQQALEIAKDWSWGRYRKLLVRSI